MNLLEFDLIKQGYIKDDLIFTLTLGPHMEVRVRLYKNGLLCYRNYDVNFVSSRDPLDGPAYESFYEDGTLATRQFIFRGQFSRDPRDGPAVESFDYKGNLTRKEYWVNNRHLEYKDLKAYGVTEKIPVFV